MDLGLLRLKYLSCMPIGDIWIKNIVTESCQQEVLSATVFSEILKDRPLSHSYTANFMKTFMSKIEEFGGEIYDCTYEAYGDILSTSAPDIEYKHYVVGDKTISLQETSSLVAEGTTGLRTWQASQYLSEYLIANTSLLENKNVLELGCGLGFLGLTLCSICKCRTYVLSDHHSSVLRKVHANISINEDQLLCVPTVESIDWNMMASSAVGLGDIDVLLAADVVYDDKLILPLAQTVKKILTMRSGQCCAIIASTIRNQETYDSFTQTISDLGLKVERTVCNPPRIFMYDDSSDIAIATIRLVES